MLHNFLNFKFANLHFATNLKKKVEQFKENFDLGINLYLDGRWKEAYHQLLLAQSMNKSDGPTITIINFMEEYNFIAPSSWPGYRPLLTK